MEKEVVALIRELFTPLSRTRSNTMARAVGDDVVRILKEVEHLGEPEGDEEARLFVAAWKLPRAERMRLIAHLVTGEMILRRLEKEQASEGIAAARRSRG
jgi:hypothetical protein